MEASSEWFLRAWGKSESMTEAELFEDSDFARAIVIVDAHLHEYMQGMCFIYGKTPKGFYVIPQGQAVRFQPSKDQHVFAYPYDVVALQLEYTPFAPTA